MKHSVLIAIDTSGIYNHQERVKDVLNVLETACNSAQIDLVTFDKRGIIEQDISNFVNSDMHFFMEEPHYTELFELMNEYDKQHVFTSFTSVDVLETQLNEFSEKSFGFIV